jgi:hypothetical protein
VGEKHCHGEGVDCKSDAPTLEPPYDEPVPGSEFDMAPSRGVAPTWVYDYPHEYPSSPRLQLAPAPGGGVWSFYENPRDELQRVNAGGVPVESHALTGPGALWTLWVDDELTPILLGWNNGYIRQTVIGPLDEVVTWTVGYIEPLPSPPLLIPGPGGRVRVGVFQQRSSYVAEHDALGDLRWQQSDVRDARDFPFEDSAPELGPNASYRAVLLSDGAIAVGMPKNWRGDLTLGLPGSSSSLQIEHGQGITLVEPDGNIRWDIVLSDATLSMLLAPGLEGSVIYATAQPVSRAAYIRLIDRDGKLRAGWLGRRDGYYEAMPSAICSDPAGDIYTVSLSGGRKAPVPTVCMLSASDPSSAVVCLGVEDVAPSDDGNFAPWISAMIAPEPGAVVFSILHVDVETRTSVARLVRVEF